MLNCFSIPPYGETIQVSNFNQKPKLNSIQHQCKDFELPRQAGNYIQADMLKNIITPEIKGQNNFI